MGKCTCKILMSVNRIVITVDRITAIFHLTDTVKGEVVKRIVLSPVGKCRDDLKGRSRLVLSLCCTVYQNRTASIRIDLIPVI